MTYVRRFASIAQQERLVKPDKASAFETIALSRQDRIIPPVDVPIVAIYDAKLDPKALEESLSRVLVRFPILAGTLTQVESRDSNKGTIKAVRLDDAGVPFVIAETDASLDDFGVFSFRRNAAGFSLPLTRPLSQAILTVKITYLSPTSAGRQGTVIGLSMDHSVVDAESATLFLNCWAEETRGVRDTKLPPPFHDRALMDSLEPRGGKMASPPPLFWQDPEITRQEVLEFISKTSNTKCEILHFSAEGLQKLKRDATPPDGWVSTHDALSALLWQATAVMRNVSDNTMMRYGSPCNIRRRLDPPLPEGYFGNAIQYVIAELPAKVVKTAPLSEVAQAIRTAVNDFTDPTIRAHLDWLRQQEESGVDMSGIRHNWTFDDLGLTSWVSFSLYSADFGEGSPLWVGPSYGTAPRMIMLLPSPPSSPGIRACVHFSAEEETPFDEQFVPAVSRYF